MIAFLINCLLSLYLLFYFHDVNRAKKRIIKKIDKIEDKNLLSQVQDILDKIVSGKKISWNTLNPKEKKSIETGLDQLNRSEYIEYEKVRKQFPGWLKR